jgi:hypothetical protein
MARGVRNRVTSRFRATDIFERRLVITIPRSGVVILAIAIVLGLRASGLASVLAIGSLVAAVVAIATTIEARHQLRTFRYDLPERINEILAAYQIPDADIRIAHDLGLIDPDEEEDDAPSIRLRLSRHR